jgi:Cadherin-like
LHGSPPCRKVCRQAGSPPQKLAHVGPTLSDVEAKDLVFTISNAKNGFVTLAAAPTRPVSRFTQADHEGGSVMFKHDGTNTSTASFNVVVADHTGATSGAPQTVTVYVRA